MHTKKLGGAPRSGGVTQYSTLGDQHMKFLRTKTVAYLAAGGLAKITIVPAFKLVDKVAETYHDTKGNLEVRYIKANLDTLSAQDKFDATVKYRSELAWVNDPIIDSTITLLHIVSKGESKKNHDFEIAYSYLSSSGVTNFTPAIEAYYMLNIQKIAQVTV